MQWKKYSCGRSPVRNRPATKPPARGDASNGKYDGRDAPFSISGGRRPSKLIWPSVQDICTQFTYTRKSNNHHRHESVSVQSLTSQSTHNRSFPVGVFPGRAVERLIFLIALLTALIFLMHNERVINACFVGVDCVMQVGYRHHSRMTEHARFCPCSFVVKQAWCFATDILNLHCFNLVLAVVVP